MRRSHSPIPLDCRRNWSSARCHAARSPEPSEIVETKQDETLRAHSLEAALASLDARSRRIIEARWLREKDSATLHELAAEFKVSAERIRQIEAKALAKMKDVIAAA